MRRIVIALCLMALAATVAAEEDGDLTLRIFDVSTITAPRLPRSGPRLGSTPSAYSPPEGEEAEGRPFLDADMIVEIIRNRIEPDSWDMDDAEIDFRDSRLYVRHRVHVMEKVKALLDTISQAASRRVRFDVAVFRTAWTSGIEPIAGKQFTPGERAEHLESGTVVAYPGIGTTFKVTNRHRIIKDFDVEIAEGSVISDPIVEASDEGFVIDLVAHPSMDGGRVAVETRIRRAEFERPIRRLKLSPRRDDYLGTVDLPILHQAYSNSTPVVTSGGRFIVPFVVDDSLIVVQIQTTVLGRGGAPWLVDMGLLTRGQQRWIVGSDPENEDEEPGRLAPELYRVWDDFKPMGSADELVELVITQVDPWYWDEEGGIEAAYESMLIMRAKREVEARVLRFLSAREKEILRPLRIDIEVASVKGPIEAGVAQAMPARLAVHGATSLATLPGKEACVQLGQTRNFVADYDVEVAQWSKIADPIIGQSFTGLAANVLPRLSMDGSTVRLDLGVLFAHRRAEKTKSVDPEAEKLGHLELVPENRRVFNSTIEMPRGALYLLDGGPDPEHKDRRLLISVRVSG